VLISDSSPVHYHPHRACAGAAPGRPSSPPFIPSRRRRDLGVSRLCHRPTVGRNEPAMSTIFLICQRGAAAARRRFNFGVVATGVSLLGLVSLGYLSGASAMYFGLPSSEYLSKAFTGAEDYFSPDAPLPAPRDLTAEARAARDPLGGAFDGLILVTPAAEAEAALGDGPGTVVHGWRMPAGPPGPGSPPAREPLPTEPIIWERVHLYPNGDLLALCSAKSASPYGYGLVKLDKDSKMLWWHSANAHHDLDVGDDARIYLLTQRLDPKPPAELKLPGTD